MREWTLEERYRPLKNAEEIRGLHEAVKTSVYRQKYHVQPLTGLACDPNGFAYYGGVWHLFYQWTPWGAVHGLKYWYHVVSKDLVHWENVGIGLRPDSDFDNKGCHSGSAIVEKDSLYFFYTGNHRDEDWVRTPYTCAAKLDEKGEPAKLEAPLFGPRPDYSEHQRDPKVFWVEEQKAYYIFIGAQSLEKKGTVLVYRSKDLLEGWEFAGPLKVIGYEDFGGMWECPCIERISGKDVLLFSPQYTTLPGRGNSTNHNVYFLGTMDYDTLTFTPEGDYDFLDYGFDLYASQLAANVGDPDKAILMGWMGLPDNHYPTEEEDWEGSLTLPRELRIENGKLIKAPVPELLSLRDGTHPADGTLPDIGELEVTFPKGETEDSDLNLFTKEDGTGGFTLHYCPHRKTLSVSKKAMDRRFNETVAEELEVPLETPLQNMRIFIDCSSVEIFLNGGEKTFTAHVYPTEGEHHYIASENVELTLWKLKSSVEDTFVL
ncbi:MAG: sucrose-6-phosphate hydrolase [Clostridia bacterium]|nr:sucrose-6-phosphate hydrolase [Clostridia bacterium]